MAFSGFSALECDLRLSLAGSIGLVDVNLRRGFNRSVADQLHEFVVVMDHVVFYFVGRDLGEELLGAGDLTLLDLS